MSAGRRLAAIVVAYDGGEALLDCLRSLLAQTVRGLEVIVVDNLSSDGSIEQAEAAFGARIRVIRRASNGGYAAGANTGWRATDAPLIAILNQDIVLEPDCLGEMRRVLLAETRDALVTPKIVLKSDPGRVNAVGNDVHLSGVASCHGLRSPAADWHGVEEVTAISGALFMGRRSLFIRLRGLEEAYFMYMEDVDLSLRLRAAGGVCLAACDAVALHDWALALTPRKFGLLERNRRSLWDRFLGRAGGLWPALLQAEAMAWAYAALRGPKYLGAKWRARTAPLALPVADPCARTLVPWLSRRHPYDVLFPRWKFVAVLGGVVDALVGHSIGGILKAHRLAGVALSHRSPSSSPRL